MESIKVKEQVINDYHFDKIYSGFIEGFCKKGDVLVNIDWANSVLIGDKKSDILAGENAGIGKNLFIQDVFPGDFHRYKK